MKKVQTYEIETEELQDNSRMGKIGAIVRLAAMAAFFALCIWFTIQRLLAGDLYHALGFFLGSFAFPSLWWVYVKACCLATPIMKAVWKWVIPLSFVGLIIKIMICISIVALPGMFYLEYVLMPFLDWFDGLNTFFEILIVVVMTPFTALFAWMDICKLRGSSFLQSVKGLFSKTSA